MKTTVTILPEDSTNYEDFVAGNSIQVRVTVSEKEAGEYAKGKTVRVLHQNEEATGKIVSNPLTVSPDSQKGSKIVSLIIERVTSKD